MTISDQSDVEALKRVGAIVAEARDTMGAAVTPGITTEELDVIGREILKKYGARSAPQLAYGFRERPDVRYGLTALCIGLGMGAAVLWENVAGVTEPAKRAQAAASPTPEREAHGG